MEVHGPKPEPHLEASRWGGQQGTPAGEVTPPLDSIGRSVLAGQPPASRATSRACPAGGELHPLEMIPFYQHPHLQKASYGAPGPVLPCAEADLASSAETDLVLWVFSPELKNITDPQLWSRHRIVLKPADLRTIPNYG